MTNDQLLAEVLRQFMRDPHNYIAVREWDRSTEVILDGHTNITPDQCNALKRYDEGEPRDRKAAAAEDAAKDALVETDPGPTGDPEDHAAHD